MGDGRVLLMDALQGSKVLLAVLSAAGYLATLGRDNLAFA